jgi:hypothetical protein
MINSFHFCSKTRHNTRTSEDDPVANSRQARSGEHLDHEDKLTADTIAVNRPAIPARAGRLVFAAGSKKQHA